MRSTIMEIKVSTVRGMIKNPEDDGYKFYLIDTDNYVYFRYKWKHYKVHYSNNDDDNKVLEAVEIEWNPFGYDMAKLNEGNASPKLDTYYVKTWYDLYDESTNKGSVTDDK